MNNNVFFTILISMQVLLISKPAFGQLNLGTGNDCTKIAIDSLRLECFDKKYGTPSHLPDNLPNKKNLNQNKDKSKLPDIVNKIYELDSSRKENSVDIVVNKIDDTTNPSVFISVPAIGSFIHEPLLMISCIDNITRLQIFLKKPVTENRLKVNLYLNERKNKQSYMWRVLEKGYVIDAGRGLHSIGIISGLFGNKLLEAELTDTEVGEAQFNIEGLADKISSLRSACHW